MLVDPHTPASLFLVPEITGADFFTSAEDTQQPAHDVQAQELWPDAWLQDADLWDPAPACPPECQADVTVSLLGPPDEQTPPGASHSSEHTWDEAMQLPGAAASVFGHQDEVSITLSGSSSQRRRTGQAASNREHQRRYRHRQRVSYCYCLNCCKNDVSQEHVRTFVSILLKVLWTCSDRHSMSSSFFVPLIHMRCCTFRSELLLQKPKLQACQLSCKSSKSDSSSSRTETPYWRSYTSSVQSGVSQAHMLKA